MESVRFRCMASHRLRFHGFRQNQPNNFFISRHVAGFEIRKNAFAIHIDVEHTETSHADSRFHAKFLKDKFLQAHGPNAVFGSNEAALNDDLHAGVVLLEESFCAPMPKILRTIQTGATKTCAGLVRKAGLLPSMKWPTQAIANARGIKSTPMMG